MNKVQVLKLFSSFVFLSSINVVNAENKVVVSDNNEPNYVQNDHLIDNDYKEAEVQPLIEETITKEDLINTLKEEDPKKIESLLAESIIKLNVEGIELTLPIYKDYVRKDESLEIWGQAFLDEKNGNYKVAISKLEEIKSKLPQVNMISFHIALFKYKNGLYNFAKKDLLALQNKKNFNPKYQKSVTSMIKNIDDRNKAHISGRVNYLSNDNLNNSPKEGTKLGNGFVAGPREKGKGISGSVNIGRRLHFDNGIYNDINFGLNGNVYVNNKKFNLLGINSSYGIGYKDERSDFKIQPFLRKQYYAGGTSDKKHHLKSYLKTYGATIFTNLNLGRSSKFSNSIGFTQNDYVDKYESNNSLDFTINNSLIYNYYSNRFVLGYDYFDRDSVTAYQSFNRNGIRFGWNKNWYNYIVTLSSLGYAYKEFSQPDFFGNQKENNEYSVATTIYSPRIQLFGIVPQFRWSYSKTVSNTDSENSSGHSFNFDIGRNF